MLLKPLTSQEKPEPLDYVMNVISNMKDIEIIFRMNVVLILIELVWLKNNAYFLTVLGLSWLKHQIVLGIFLIALAGAGYVIPVTDNGYTNTRCE